MPYDPRGRYYPLSQRGSLSHSIQYFSSFREDEREHYRNRPIRELLRNLELWAQELPLRVADCNSMYSRAMSAQEWGHYEEVRSTLNKLRDQLDAIDDDLKWNGIQEAPRPNMRR